MINKLIPEKNKKPGVCYAYTDDGIELPVIDLTHPVFAMDLTPQQLAEEQKNFIKQQQDFGKTPAIIKSLFNMLFFRRSMLYRAVSELEGGFLGGIDTYIMKLGPNNMGKGYATGIDRMITKALPSSSMRIRLEGISRISAGHIKQLLAADKKAGLDIVNIAGGPCPDSINTLLMINKSGPELLKGRKTTIHAFDLVQSGPAFAARAIMALTGHGNALSGLDINVKYAKYDWADASVLSAGLAEIKAGSGIVFVASEGGLFEYGNDNIIVSNLRTIRDSGIRNIAVCGSVTSDGEMTKYLKMASKAQTIQRSAETFAALAEQDVWEVKSSEQGTFSRNVLLLPL